MSSTDLQTLLPTRNKPHREKGTIPLFIVGGILILVAIILSFVSGCASSSSSAAMAAKVVSNEAAVTLEQVQKAEHERVRSAARVAWEVCKQEEREALLACRTSAIADTLYKAQERADAINKAVTVQRALAMLLTAWEAGNGAQKEAVIKTIIASLPELQEAITKIRGF